MSPPHVPWARVNLMKHCETPTIWTGETSVGGCSCWGSVAGRDLLQMTEVGKGR